MKARGAIPSGLPHFTFNAIAELRQLNSHADELFEQPHSAPANRRLSEPTSRAGAPQHCNALRPPSNVIFLGQSAALTAVHSISTIHLKSTNLYRQTSHFVRGIAERSNSSAASHAQSSAPSQRNCRSFRAQKKKPAVADELHMLKTGLEPVRIAPRDFKSPASAISPLQPILFYVMRREIIPPRPIRSSIVPAYVAHAVKDSAASEKSAAAVKSPACPIGVSRSAQARCVLSSPSPQPFRQLIEPANILCRDHDRPVQNRLLLP